MWELTWHEKIPFGEVLSWYSKCSVNIRGQWFTSSLSYIGNSTLIESGALYAGVKQIKRSVGI